MANAADIFQIGGRHVKLGEVSAAVALASQSANGKGRGNAADKISQPGIGGNRSERACFDRRRARNPLCAG
jgi:hypothetical protein